MSLRRFVLFTAFGDAIWNGAMTAAGYLLKSRYPLVANYLGPVVTTVLTIVALTYITRILRWKRGH